MGQNPRLKRRRAAAKALPAARWLGLSCAVWGMNRQARAIVIRDDTPDSQYTSASAQSQYAAEGYVDVLTGTSGTLDYYNVGTGTLIAPDWILTAAHVVTVNEGSTAYSNADVSFGQGTTRGYPGADAIAQVDLESGWSGSFAQGNDLALIQLSVPITNVQPASIYTGSTSSLIGQTATVVGYGDTGNGLTGYIAGSDGTRRAMQNSIDALGGGITNGGAGNNVNYSFTNYSSNLLLTDFDSPNAATAAAENIMGSSTALPLEGSTAPGDSGGGLFVTDGGTTYLAGVTSFAGSFITNPPVGVYGEINAFTGVSAASSLNFIDSILATSSIWSAGGNNKSWTGLNNWFGGNPPEFAGATAVFSGAIQAPSTITLDAGWTVGAVVFVNAYSYTLSPGSGGSMTLDNGASLASITDINGSHTISAPVYLNSSAAISVVSAGNTLTISGNISGAGGVSLSGSGALALSGVNSYAQPTSVTSGTLLINSAGALPNGNALQIGTAATTARTQFALSIGTVSLSSLSINSGSTLDITNNAVAINYGSVNADPVTAIAAALKSGAAFRAGGSNYNYWNGTGIVSSTIAAIASSNEYAVGYLDGDNAGDNRYGTVAPNQILVECTLNGDAFLEASVGNHDLQIVAANYGAGTGMDWADGSFDYSGSVGNIDLQTVAANYGNVSPHIAGSLADGGSVLQLAWNSAQSVSVVPEPTSLVLVTAGAGALLARRRRLELRAPANF